MGNQEHESAKQSEDSGDPGRTPGSAEGDRETVEADLNEKQDDAAENYEKTKEKKLAESDTGNN